MQIAGQLRLVQNATVQYNQRTEARFEVGSSRLYWACGQSQGQLTLNKLVGDGGGAGIWEPFSGAISASTQAGNAQAFTFNTAAGTLTGDGVFQQVTASFNVGDMAIQDNAVMAVGDLRRTGGGGLGGFFGAIAGAFGLD
jgi:hypothetical protein